MGSGSGHFSLDLYNLSNDDKEYWMPKNFAERTARCTDSTTRLFTAGRISFNSLPVLQKNRGQVDRILNDYYTDPMEISSILLIQHITDWWCQQEEIHSKYADISNVAPHIFSITQHHVRVEASFSVSPDIIGWMQSKTTGKTYWKKVIARQFAPADHRILAGNNPVLDMTETENDFEMKWEVEECILHRMAKVHGFLESLQHSHNLSARPKESWAQNKQMSAIQYISNSEVL